VQIYTYHIMLGQSRETEMIINGSGRAFKLDPRPSLKKMLGPGRSMNFSRADDRVTL